MKLALLIFFSSAVFAETWTGYLSDVSCKRQDVSSHPVSCMLGCAKGGFGLVQRNGEFLKFDDAGNEKALAVLKSASKEKEIEIKVTGTLKDGVVNLTSIEPL